MHPKCHIKYFKIFTKEHEWPGKTLREVLGGSGSLGKSESKEALGPPRRPLASPGEWARARWRWGVRPDAVPWDTEPPKGCVPREWWITQPTDGDSGETHPSSQALVPNLQAPVSCDLGTFSIRWTSWTQKAPGWGFGFHHPLLSYCWGNTR